jgi:hypothetical protein
MTKKSDARLARDAAEARTKKDLKDNKCWDDLNTINASCAALLLSHNHLSQYSNSKDLIACVVDKESLKQNLRLLASDLRKMTSELAELEAQHSGKTGGSQDPDEIVGTYEIYERYNLFMERHQAVVMPTAMHITDLFTEAEKRLKGALEIATAETDMTNPNVVSDVEFKEVVVDSNVNTTDTTTNIVVEKSD